MQTNLYGEVRYYTEVRWSFEALNNGATVVSAEARLVDPSGVRINPAHVIEPLTRVLKVGDVVRVLAPTPFD